MIECVVFLISNQLHHISIFKVEIFKLIVVVSFHSLPSLYAMYLRISISLHCIFFLFSDECTNLKVVIGIEKREDNYG